MSSLAQQKAMANAMAQFHVQMADQGAQHLRDLYSAAPGQAKQAEASVANPQDPAQAQVAAQRAAQMGAQNPQPQGPQGGAPGPAMAPGAAGAPGQDMASQMAMHQQLMARHAQMMQQHLQQMGSGGAAQPGAQPTVGGAPPQGVPAAYQQQGQMRDMMMARQAAMQRMQQQGQVQ